MTVTKNDTVILDGAGESASIQERCELIQNSIETTKSDYEREKLQERLAKLSDGVAVLVEEKHCFIARHYLMQLQKRQKTWIKESELK